MKRPYHDPPGPDAPEFPRCEIEEGDTVMIEFGRSEDSPDTIAIILDYDDSMLLMHRLCAVHGYKAVRLPDMTTKELEEALGETRKDLADTLRKLVKAREEIEDLESAWKESGEYE